MISIVICSSNQKRFDFVSENIRNTIGTPYEIIRIENKDRRYSLCQAYNKGKALCQYEIVCFAHEDIEIFTQNWGSHLMDVLSDKSIGLVGVLGACYLSLFPPNWLDPNEVEGQILEGYKAGNPLLKLVRFPGNKLPEVVSIDGVFMVSRKEVLNTLNFSEDILTDFHGYDFDISMQIRQKYKVVVTRDLLLSHASNGNFNEAYFEAVKKLSKKWKHQLPAYISSYTKTEIDKLKLKSLRFAWQYHECNNKYPIPKIQTLTYAAKHGVFFPWLIKVLNGLKAA